MWNFRGYTLHWWLIVPQELGRSGRGHLSRDTPLGHDDFYLGKMIREPTQGLSLWDGLRREECPTWQLRAPDESIPGVRKVITMLGHSGCCNKHHMLVRSGHRNSSSSVLETRVWDPDGAGPLRSRRDRPRLPPEALGGALLLASSSFLGLQASLDLWPHPSHLCLHPCVASPLRLCLLFFFSKDTCHWIQGHAHPGWDPYINYICKELFSK